VKKVLVVDDDPELLQYTTTTLNRGGIPSVGALSGAEALCILSRKHSVRLLLTDIVMPRTTGLELAAEVKALDSELPIVFMTGYLSDHMEQFGDALEGRQILGKPFTPAELLMVVRNALGLVEKAKSGGVASS
jgi:CheY-like chemotaxis protein